MCASFRGAWLQPLQAFVLLALVARVFVPPGYMIAPSGTAWVKVVLCAAHGPIDVFVDPVTYEITDKQPVPAKKADGQDPPCAFFFALAKLAPPVALPALTPMQTAETIAPALPHFDEPERGLSAPPPPSTGPPHHHA